jgi:NitT/TauT family transport system permease protein
MSEVMTTSGTSGRAAALQAGGIPARHRYGTLLRYAEPALVVASLLATWELLTRAGVLRRQDIPPVTTIVGRFVSDVQTRVLWDAVAQSVGAWAAALGLVIIIAIPLGLLLGSSRRAYEATHLTLEFLRTIPSIAALPLLIFIFGVGFRLTVVLGILTALWPLLIQTTYGVHDVDPVARETGRVYGLSRSQQFTRIVLPGALPYIATGLRLSGGIALIVSIATSLVVGGEGLGKLIASAAQNGQTELMYARILLTSLVGLAVAYTLMRLERRALQWHPSQWEAQA